MTAPLTVGILGTGRLGRALAGRLTPRLGLRLADADAATAARLGRELGVPVDEPEKLASTCDVVLLCVPPEQIRPALLAAVGAARPGTTFVNTATSCPTGELADDPRLRGVEVVGLKPVCQYLAVTHRVPTVFVTGSARSVPLLRRVVGEIGTVLTGDESVVGPLNRAATLAALAACELFGAQARALTDDPRLIRAAVNSVLAGTAMEFPPDPANPYTSALLTLLHGSTDAAAERPIRVNDDGPGAVDVDDDGTAAGDR